MALPIPFLLAHSSAVPRQEPEFSFFWCTKTILLKAPQPDFALVIKNIGGTAKMQRFFDIT